MSSENIELLNEESFFSKLVPYFEEMKSKLLAILGKDKKWEKLLSRLYLTCDAVGELQLSRDSNRHLFLSDPSQTGFSLNENTYYSIRVLLRMLFNEEVVSRLTPSKIGSYIRRILGGYYSSIEEIKTSNYIRFRFNSINTSNALLPLYPYKTNIVIPKGTILDATETVGQIGIDHRGGIDKIVLVTNKKDIEGYNNFDTVLDLKKAEIACTGPGRCLPPRCFSGPSSGVVRDSRKNFCRSLRDDLKADADRVNTTVDDTANA